jgi:hypothetical protein
MAPSTFAFVAPFLHKKIVMYLTSTLYKEQHIDILYENSFFKFQRSFFSSYFKRNFSTILGSVKCGGH